MNFDLWFVECNSTKTPAEIKSDEGGTNHIQKKFHPEIQAKEQL